MYNHCVCRYVRVPLLPASVNVVYHSDTFCSLYTISGRELLLKFPDELLQFCSRILPQLFQVLSNAVEWGTTSIKEVCRFTYFINMYIHLNVGVKKSVFSLVECLCSFLLMEYYLHILLYCAIYRTV